MKPLDPLMGMMLNGVTHTQPNRREEPLKNVDDESSEESSESSSEDPNTSDEEFLEESSDEYENGEDNRDRGLRGGEAEDFKNLMNMTPELFEQTYDSRYVTIQESTLTGGQKRMATKVLELQFMEIEKRRLKAAELRKRVPTMSTTRSPNTHKPSPHTQPLSPKRASPKRAPSSKPSHR